MISGADIDALVKRKAPPGDAVLSVYLEIDQSKAANLNRRFEAALKSLLSSVAAGLTEDQQENFQADAEAVRQYVANLEPCGKGVMVFSERSENFFGRANFKWRCATPPAGPTAPMSRRCSKSSTSTSAMAWCCSIKSRRAFSRSLSARSKNITTPWRRR